MARGGLTLDWRSTGEALLGPERFRTGKLDLLAYSYDATGEKSRPEAVAFPASTAEVVALLRLAALAGIAVVPRGSGTNLSGGTVPVAGGLVITSQRLNNIFHLDPGALLARVQPGVVNGHLQEKLRPLGLRFAPDPSSWRVSTLGGNAAENAGGPHGLSQGVTAEHLAGLEVVWSDGSIERYGPEESSAAALAIGSEGTLGVITELSLRLQPRPESYRTARISFPAMGSALAAVSAMIAARLRPAALEVMDQGTIGVVEPFVRAGLPLTVGALLLVELEGEPAELTPAGVEVERVAWEAGAAEVRWAASEAEREALWLGRRSVWGALARISPTFWTQDVTVPRPQLGAMFSALSRIAAAYDLPIYTVAHAGDGNLHPAIPYGPGDRERLLAADAEIVAAAVELGGSLTGEHGVGLEKRAAFGRLGRPGELWLMGRVKETLDPRGLLNPGKLLPEVIPECVPEAPAPSLPTPFAAERAASAAAYLARAHSDGQPVRLGTGAECPGTQLAVAHREIVSLAAENLTVTVGSGLSWGNLQAFLAERDLEWAARPLADPTETVGAVLARGLSAPAPFNLEGGVLGLEVITATGRHLRLGGQVMKNVANYRLWPLFIGTRGAFGLIWEATLRLWPAPTAVVVEFYALTDLTTAQDAARQILKASWAPLGVEVLSPGRAGLGGAWGLRLTWAGAEAAVEASREQAAKRLGAPVRSATERPGPEASPALYGYLHPERWSELLDCPGLEFCGRATGEGLHVYTSDPVGALQAASALGGRLRPWGTAPRRSESLERLRRELDPRNILVDNGGGLR